MSYDLNASVREITAALDRVAGERPTFSPATQDAFAHVREVEAVIEELRRAGWCDWMDANCILNQNKGPAQR